MLTESAVSEPSWCTSYNIVLSTRMGNCPFLAWVYTMPSVPSGVAAGVTVPTAPMGVEGSLCLVCACSTWVPLFSQSDPYSVGLTLVQLVRPLFSRSDPYSVSLTPVQLV